ncbi:MAG: sodium:solute symporter family transporter [Hyphomicrobiaceae bacterium]
MSMPHRTRLVNPRLGTYFGIFASAFIGLFLVLLILEQLDGPAPYLEAVVLVGPLLLFVAIATASWTSNVGEYFAAGRRVPAVYNGLVLAVSAFGGTGVIAFTGLFFLNGFDTWFLAIGFSSGFLIMGIVISPYLRKYGAYTVPSYLARRFESRLVRLLTATVFAVPMILLLTAELSMAVHAGVLLTGFAHEFLALLFAAVLVGTMAFGGMRAVGWVGTAQAIAAIIAIVVLAGIIGLIMTNLPLAQLSFGPVLRRVGRLEEAQQIVTPASAMWAYGLAGQELTFVTQRLAAPFGSVGWAGFLAGTLTVMMGVAGAPWLLPRCATTLGVYEARKSMGWAIFFTGVIVLTLSSIAVFLRSIVMSDLVGRSVDQMPIWFVRLTELGLAGVSGRVPALPLSSFAFSRDGVLYAAPLASGFPAVVHYLVMAGGIAAALAAAAATAFALAAILAEDVFGGLKWEPARDTVRINTARVMCFVVVTTGLLFYALVRTDPLELLLSALAFSAATAFPIVTLSIWWKRLSALGTVCSVLAGFGVLVTLHLASAGGVPIATPVAGIMAAIAAFVAAVIVSLLASGPHYAALEATRDMRIPGGETVYDREMRQMRFSQRDNE